MPGGLFIHPNQIADRSGVCASFVHRLEYVDLARSGIAVFAEISVEGQKIYVVKIDTLFREKVKRKNARLS